MGKYDKQVKEILSVTAVTILCTAATENKCSDRTYDIFISYVLVYVVCLGDVGTDV